MDCRAKLDVDKICKSSCSILLAAFTTKMMKMSELYVLVKSGVGPVSVGQASVFKAA